MGTTLGASIGPAGAIGLGAAAASIGQDVGGSIGSDPMGGYGPGSGVSIGGPQP